MFTLGVSFDIRVTHSFTRTSRSNYRLLPVARMSAAIGVLGTHRLTFLSVSRFVFVLVFSLVAHTFPCSAHHDARAPPFSSRPILWLLTGGGVRSFLFVLGAMERTQLLIFSGSHSRRNDEKWDTCLDAAERTLMNANVHILAAEHTVDNNGWWALPSPTPREIDWQASLAYEGFIVSARLLILFRVRSSGDITRSGQSTTPLATPTRLVCTFLHLSSRLHRLVNRRIGSGN